MLLFFFHFYFLILEIKRTLFSKAGDIYSLSWAKSSHKLISGSRDGLLHEYDVLSGEILKTIKFDSFISVVKYHPKNDNLCVVCPLSEVPYLINLSIGEKTPLPEPKDEESSSETESTHKLIAAYVAFNKNGDKLFAGTSKGMITVFDTNTLQILYSFKIPGGALIRGICFNFNGKQFLVNSNDQKVRLFEGEDSKVAIREFQDPVNKIQWQKCCFSWDGETIVTGSTDHKIYIWNGESGRLQKTLEGTRDGLVDMQVIFFPLNVVVNIENFHSGILLDLLSFLLEHMVLYIFGFVFILKIGVLLNLDLKN